jgi:Tol biopolymer transport system component
MIRRVVLLCGFFPAVAILGCVDDPATGPRKEHSRRPAAAFSATANGKIVFTSARDGNSELYLMDSDGLNQTRLTTHPASDVGPAWAPDGRQLAFTSNRDGNLEIYAMNASCPNQAPVRLTNNSVVDAGGTWSADGSKIAFTSERDGEFRQIYVMAADGSEPTNLSNVGEPSVGIYSDEQPHWSPDGTKIAFARGGGSIAGDVIVMNADGSGKVNLTNHSANDAPMDWSPDGSKILFASNRDHENYELYAMNADGTGVTRLTTNGAFEYPASWSPDGTKIVISLFHNEIWAMDANGANLVNLSNNVAVDVGPSWAVPPTPAVDTDCDGIYDVVDIAPAEGSMRFSDIPLGGATAGTIVSVPANTAVRIEDDAGTGGVRVTTFETGSVGGGARVHLSIDGKQGQVKLAIPGSYVITDPATSMTVAVNTAGPAEVEYTINGSPIVISISDGASAVINETTNSSGVLTDVTLSNVTGNSGDVTANGTTVPPGGPPYSIPTATLSATLSVRGGKLTATGSLNPNGATGIDPATQTVTFTAGNYSFVKTDGLRRNPGNVFTFEGTLPSAPGVQLKLTVKAPKAGSSLWTFEATASPVSGFVNPVTVSLQIGGVKGSVPVTASLR